MLLKEIMTPNPECVAPEDSLQDAARKMRDLDVGPMLVCDHDRLTGVLTDRDIVVTAIAEGKDPRTTYVREVMSEGVIWGFEDQDVEEAARTMREKQIRRLPVLNHEKRLVGIVSLGDLATERGTKGESGGTLREISEPSAPRR